MPPARHLRRGHAFQRESAGAAALVEHQSRRLLRRPRRHRPVQLRHAAAARREPVQPAHDRVVRRLAHAQDVQQLRRRLRVPELPVLPGEQLPACRKVPPGVPVRPHRVARARAQRDDLGQLALRHALHEHRDEAPNVPVVAREAVARGEPARGVLRARTAAVQPATSDHRRRRRRLRPLHRRLRRNKHAVDRVRRRGRVAAAEHCAPAVGVASERCGERRRGSRGPRRRKRPRRVRRRVQTQPTAPREHERNPHAAAAAGVPRRAPNGAVLIGAHRRVR
mmetsp:Transcript_35554/g.109619  ORF Transcript_35554/g.109619 Transcript_35554/m.109619 type:complete len:280 (-) Transcript_35554:886-1725(-)